MPLKIHLLIRNDENVIENAITSLLPLDSEIIVGNIGSKDKSQAICKNYGIEVVAASGDDLSKTRNKLLGEDWNFFIHPWEVLAAGHERIKEAVESNEKTAYYLQTYSGQIINYEIRLFRRLEFKNPIFETVSCDFADCLSGGIVYVAGESWTPDIFSAKKWTNDQSGIEPYYYESFVYLENKQYNEFRTTAEYYLSLDSKSMSSIMLRYYLSQVELLIFKDTSKAVRHIITCLCHRPLMAEFWCLLGDIFYKLKKYNKAKEFYDNAMILGSRRLSEDLWPIEILKYNDYPVKMIKSCTDILGETNLFGVVNR